eukprot:COSAG01_NODE_5762_length_4048_cov_3.069385_4_plen_248_part_00
MAPLVVMDTSLEAREAAVVVGSSTNRNSGSSGTGAAGGGSRCGAAKPIWLTPARRRCPGAVRGPVGGCSRGGHCASRSSAPAASPAAATRRGLVTPAARRRSTATAKRTRHARGHLYYSICYASSRTITIVIGKSCTLVIFGIFYWPFLFVTSRLVTANVSRWLHGESLCQQRLTNIQIRLVNVCDKQHIAAQARADYLVRPGAVLALIRLFTRIHRILYLSYPLIRYPDWPSAQKCISLLRSASLQ